MNWFGYFLASYMLADLLSGFWHWIEDRYFDEEWPLVGRYISKPNNLHHEQPLAFLSQCYWSRNWASIIPALVLFLLTYPNSCCLVFVFVSQANQVHAWAHSKGKVSPWISVLQGIGFFQSPKHHAEHHRSPFEVKYCVMSDWVNPLLDWIDFWRRLEYLVALLFRIHPREDPATKK